VARVRLAEAALIGIDPAPGRRVEVIAGVRKLIAGIAWKMTLVR
jgi:hypothetical protein